MRREKSPWETIREETQKSRASSTPRQDLHHYLNKKPVDRSKEKNIIQLNKKLINVNSEDQASRKTSNK
jgi:hypothetical protein